MTETFGTASSHGPLISLMNMSSQAVSQWIDKTDGGETGLTFCTAGLEGRPVEPQIAEPA